MTAQSGDSTQAAIRTRMKGAIVKVLEKAKREPKAGDKKHFTRAGGYVTLAQSGLKKMFMTDAWWIDCPGLDVARPAPADAGRDPVKLLAFAINALGAASCRAAFLGTPVTVAVEDEATADVMRAALRLSCTERPTNRLIRIKVRTAASLGDPGEAFP